jgi:cytochrome P450
VAQGEAWLVTRHPDVRAVLSDSRFSVSPILPEGGHVPEQNDSLFQDPPGHTRLRNIAAKPFTATRIRLLQESIQAWAEELLGKTLEREVPFDFMESFAYPLTMNAIAQVIGIPHADRADFRRRADAMLVPLESARSDTSATGWRWLNDYVESLLRSRRAAGNPGEDVIASFLEACDEQALVNEEELVTMILGLPIAGYVSTANALAVAVEQLVAHGWLAELRASPGLIDPFVEEVLRVQSGDNGESMPRFATMDMEFRGVLIRRGDIVLAPLVAANRDASVFKEPMAFDPRRESNRHIAFGFGIHRCLGASLARTELRCAVRAMTATTGSLSFYQDWQVAPLRSNMFGDLYPETVMLCWSDETA